MSTLNSETNFYEQFTFEQVDDGDQLINVITIKQPPRNNPFPEDYILDDMITRDFCPLFYTVYYDDGENGPSMSTQQLYEVHKARNDGLEYDTSCILNHGWIDKIKEMIGWEHGKEIIFKATCWHDSIAILYNLDENVEYTHKIDTDGFLCSKIPVPIRYRHIYRGVGLQTEIQRVVCWYNINLEESQSPYVLK